MKKYYIGDLFLYTPDNIFDHYISCTKGLHTFMYAFIDKKLCFAVWSDLYCYKEIEQ